MKRSKRMNAVRTEFSVPADTGTVVYVQQFPHVVVGVARDGSHRLRVQPLEGGRNLLVHPKLDIAWPNLLENLSPL